MTNEILLAGFGGQGILLSLIHIYHDLPDDDS